MEEKFTSYEPTVALLNLGYRPLNISGFKFDELKNILYKKYKGELNIMFKTERQGFVAFFNEEEVLNTANFDPLTPVIDALATLLLMLDKKFMDQYLEDKAVLQASS